MLVLAHEMVQTYSALRLFAGVWDMQTLKLHVESSLEKLSSGERRKQFKLNKMRTPECASDQILAEVVPDVG
jgi:hypothetical protein